MKLPSRNRTEEDWLSAKGRASIREGDYLILFISYQGMQLISIVCSSLSKHMQSPTSVSFLPKPSGLSLDSRNSTSSLSHKLFRRIEVMAYMNEMTGLSPVLYVAADWGLFDLIFCRRASLTYKLPRLTQFFQYIKSLGGSHPVYYCQMPGRCRGMGE